MRFDEWIELGNIVALFLLGLILLRAAMWMWGLY